MRPDKRVLAVAGFVLGVLVVVGILCIVAGNDLPYLQNEKKAYVYMLKEAEAQSQTEEAVQGTGTAQQTALAKRAVVTRDYCLIGDSRTKGLNQATGLSANLRFYVIAEVSMGYDWMMYTALPEAAQTGRDEYVILLGVNDLENIDRYLDAYRALTEQGIHLTLATVGPVEEGKGGYSVTNYRIDKFNERLCEAEGARVIDLNAYLWKHGFSTQDGVHYTDETYRLIEEFLLLELE